MEAVGGVQRVHDDFRVDGGGRSKRAKASHAGGKSRVDTQFLVAKEWSRIRRKQGNPKVDFVSLMNAWKDSTASPSPAQAAASPISVGERSTPGMTSSMKRVSASADLQQLLAQCKLYDVDDE